MKPSIVAINNYYHLLGGSERYLFSLNALLAKHGHRVSALSTYDQRNIKPMGPHAFVPAIDLRKPKLNDIPRFIYSSQAASALRRLVRDERPDVAHLHIYYGQLTGSILLALRSYEIPIIQTLHEYKTVCPVYTLISNGAICEACRGFAFWHAVLRRCNRRSLLRSTLSMIEAYVSRAVGAVRLIDQFIAPSEFLRQKVVELGIPAHKVAMIHYFIDSSAVAPSTEPGQYFLYFGRLERVKGLFTLLKAGALCKEVPLVLVGEGNARSELEAFIEQNGLRHIRVLGFRDGDELGAIIRKSICCIVPSEWYENCPMTVLESFAFGKPVIGSAIGGIPELVDDGVDGFLVGPANWEQLAERLIWMAAHRTEAIEMGLAGRQKIENRFSPEIHYAAISQVYRSVL